MLGVGFFFMLSEFAQAQTATELLAQAEKLADRGDRYRAGPSFAKAEAAFRTAGNTSQEFYARFGRLHAESEHGNYKAVRAQVEQALTNPIVQNDPQLKIQALSVLGTVDLNIDTASAGSDWKELLETATAVGDVKWQNRARGELGLVAALNGNIGEAGAALFKAIATAEKIGDFGADPEAHQTSNGTAVTNLSLATKSSWKKEDGSYESRTEWHRIVLWGKMAESAAKLAKALRWKSKANFAIAPIRRKFNSIRRPSPSIFHSPQSTGASCAS